MFLTEIPTYYTYKTESREETINVALRKVRNLWRQKLPILILATPLQKSSSVTFLL